MFRSIRHTIELNTVLENVEDFSFVSYDYLLHESTWVHFGKDIVLKINAAEKTITYNKDLIKVKDLGVFNVAMARVIIFTFVTRFNASTNLKKNNNNNEKTIND